MVRTGTVEDLSLKFKANQKHGDEVEKVAKEAKGHGDPLGGDLRVRSILLRGIPSRR